MSQKVELPDIDELFKMIEDIRDKSLQKGLLEIKIKAMEGDITNEVVSNPIYKRDGKTPSQAYIDSAYKYAGINNEMIPLRETLVTLDIEIGYLKAKFDLLKALIDIWKAESYNTRSSL